MNENTYKTYKNNGVLKNESNTAYHILCAKPNMKHCWRRRLTSLTWLLVIVWWHIRQHPHFPSVLLTFVVSCRQSFGMQTENGEKGRSRKDPNTTNFGIKCCCQNTTHEDVIWGRWLWRRAIDSQRWKKQNKKVWIYKETRAVWEDMEERITYKNWAVRTDKREQSLVMVHVICVCVFAVTLTAEAAYNYCCICLKAIGEKHTYARVTCAHAFVKYCPLACINLMQASTCSNDGAKKKRNKKNNSSVGFRTFTFTSNEELLNSKHQLQP